MSCLIKYICYETSQAKSKLSWLLYYHREVDHDIYGTFDIWWADMLRSHVLERL